MTNDRFQSKQIDDRSEERKKVEEELRCHAEEIGQRYENYIMSIARDPEAIEAVCNLMMKRIANLILKPKGDLKTGRV